MSDYDDEKPRKVGYKNPPVEHRFKKKQEGSAKSGKRTRKAKPKKGPDLSSIPGDVFLNEMFRTLPVGDDGSEITIHQAVIRSTQKKATVDRSPMAQKVLIERAEVAMRERLDSFLRMFEIIIDYQAAAAAKTRRYQRTKKIGLMPPPEDLAVDAVQMRIGFRGGVFPAERQARAKLRQLHAEGPQVIAKLEREMRRHPEDPEWPALLEQVRRGQALLERLLPSLDDWEWYYLQPQQQAA